jgi:LacI family transcriptional regulator
VKKHQTTIHDIARHLNITASTVSRALNNHPRISDSTKKKVRDAAEELNYRPNSIAANLRRGSGNTNGIIIPVINRYFFANIIHGIESIMAPAGYNLIICPSNESLVKEASNIQTLISNRVSGILISISSETHDPAHFEGIFRSGIPLVQFDRVIDSISTCKVTNDDFQGAYESVSHLIEQGFRRIAHFAGPRYISAYQQRYKGYRQALSDHQLEFQDDMLFERVISRNMGSETMEKILSRWPGIDAIFAASDMSALGALLVLKAKGIRIPEDFGITGYVNEPFGEYMEPSLTTTEQFGEEIGKTAARELLERIVNPKQTENQLITINPKLIVRKSSFRSSETGN